MWPEAPGNLCYDWELGDEAATDKAFESAHHITSLDLVNNRLIPNAMEPRAAIGDYDQATGDYTLYTTSQNPHVIRLLMGAFVLQIPEHKLRVYAPDGAPPPGYEPVEGSLEDAYMTLVGAAANGTADAAGSDGSAPAPAAPVETAP